jgi:hypothetical protein
MICIKVKAVIAIEHYIGVIVGCRPALPMIPKVGYAVVMDVVANCNAGAVPSGPTVLLDNCDPIAGRCSHFDSIIVHLSIPRARNQNLSAIQPYVKRFPISLHRILPNHCIVADLMEDSYTFVLNDRVILV